MLICRYDFKVSAFFMKTNLAKIIAEQIHQNRWQQKKFLLAVSGGKDSMVLLHALNRLKVHFEIAHVNYGFRGEESDKEAELVIQTTEQYMLKHHLLVLNGYQDLQSSGTNNLQDYARQKRYDFFRKIKEENKLDFIVTAHHLNDQVETILYRFLKGKTIKGFSGMSVLKEDIWRPLLTCSQEQISQYAKDNKVPYLTDSSNLEDSYDRNFLRNQLIPLVESRFPDFIKNISGNAGRNRDFLNYFQSYLSARKKLVFNDQQGSGFLDIQQWKREKYRNDLLLEIIQDFMFTPHQLEPFLKLIDSRNGALISNDSYMAIKENNKIFFEPKDKPAHHLVLITKDDLQYSKPIFISEKTIFIKQEIVDESEVKLKIAKQFVSMQGLVFPLLIRPVRSGDYFYPLGLNKKKKISHFLIDEKVPIHKRSQILVLVAGTKIVAVIGHRIDHRFRLKTYDSEVLSIELKQSH